MAVTIAEELPPNMGNALALTAKESFMDGWQVMAFITCGMSVIGAILVLKFMPPWPEPVPDDPPGPDESRSTAPATLPPEEPDHERASI